MCYPIIPLYKPNKECFKYKHRYMRVFLFALLFLLMMMSLNSSAQELKNELQLQLGLSHIARQDLVFSPFINRDLSPINFGIRYQRERNLYQNLHLRFSLLSPSLTEPYEFIDNDEIKQTSPHFSTLIDLDYWIGKEFRGKEKSSTKAGLAFNADIQALNYVYGRIGSFGYYSTFGLGGFVSHTHKFNEKNKLTGQVALPLFSWLARSPYLVNDDEFIENTISHSGIKTFFAFIGDGNLATLNKLQTLDLRLNYTYKLNDRWAIGADYLFEFIHSKEPRNLLSYRNTMFLNTNYKF